MNDLLRFLDVLVPPASENNNSFFSPFVIALIIGGVCLIGVIVSIFIFRYHDKRNK